MIKPTFIAAAAMLIGAASAAAQHSDTIVYENAMVWTGSGFAERDLATRGGRILDVAEAAPDAQRVDCSGRFIVPPYANAHVHITNALKASSDGYLEKGVFYTWNPTVIALGEGAGAFFARPDTYDVKIARGGITEPGGHPEMLYEKILGPNVYDGRTGFLGDAYHYGRTPAEIDAALDLLGQQGAQFVKGYLLSSEAYEERRDDEAFYGNKGMNPANAAYLVLAARERGLPVTFHVETAHDLVVAAKAGAYAAMHLPGYGLLGDPADALARVLTPDQAQLVAESGMLLVPTYGIASARAQQVETDAGRTRAQLAFAVQRHNLALLKEAGAEFIVGTDGFTSILPEIEHIDSLGIFARERLLRDVFGTSRHLFPERNLGCLAAGCDADFLVLRGNPIKSLAALEDIERRVKAGSALSLGEPDK